jgi:hypothetical protein
LPSIAQNVVWMGYPRRRVTWKPLAYSLRNMPVIPLLSKTGRVVRRGAEDKGLESKKAGFQVLVSVSWAAACPNYVNPK